MFYSKKYNFLFIASPKTGSTSVEKFLTELDPEGEMWRIELGDKIITSANIPSKSIGHVRANELKNTMGTEKFNKINTFGFIRHPMDKLVSSYFYNKKLSLKNALIKKDERNRFITVFSGIINVLAAKLFPFGIWALLFPLKTNKEYFVDQKGELVVKFLGCTEFLNTDLKAILKKFSINTENIQIPHINRSGHRNYHEYFNNSLFRSLIKRKYETDIKFYEKTKKNMRILIQAKPHKRFYKKIALLNSFVNRPV